MSKKINLGTAVNSENLKTALVKSAGEIGLEAKVKDEYKDEYSLKPNPPRVREIKEYRHSDILLLANSSEVIRIMLPGPKATCFFIDFCGKNEDSEKETEGDKALLRRYLEIVAKNLYSSRV